jgi:hypothetical protein
LPDNWRARTSGATEAGRKRRNGPGPGGFEGLGGLEPASAPFVWLPIGPDLGVLVKKG